MTDTPQKDKEPLDELLKKLTASAFDDREAGFRHIFLTRKPDDIRALFDKEETFCMVLSDLAFREKAPCFEALLRKFGNDTVALEAIRQGFERDKAYARRDSMTVWGPDPDEKDLEAKRQALRDFVASKLRKDKKPFWKPRFRRPGSPAP